MKKTNTFTISKGILFGTLLSAAQLTWADSAPLLEPGMRIECVSDPRPATYIIQLQYDSVAPLYVQENFLNEEPRFYTNGSESFSWSYEADGAVYNLNNEEMTLVLTSEIAEDGSIDGYYMEIGDSGDLDCRLQKK